MARYLSGVDMLLCESCEKTSNSTKYRLDPFVEDVLGEKRWLHMCDKCYLEACADI